MTDQSMFSYPEPAAFDFVFRTASDGILMTDAAGHIVRVNPAAASMLSMNPDELVGRQPDQVFRYNAALLNLFSREGEQSLDVHLPRRRLAVGIAATLESGERVVVLHDVTERRALETRREALMKAIRHDLRNPISAISGYADLVVKFGALNEQQIKFMTRIRQTTTKLYDLVGPLVDLAWIEAGMPMEHRPVDLGDVIRRALRDLETHAKDNQLTFALSLQNPMPLVMGDAARLQQVVHNIVHNAVMYSLPETTIAVHAWGDNEEAYCSVADQGIGIADDELDLIFDRMYRSRDEAVRSMPGGGLGLTLARTIIQRHGGDIWAASNLGHGSTFTFVLPISVKG